MTQDATGFTHDLVDFAGGFPKNMLAAKATTDGMSKTSGSRDANQMLTAKEVETMLKISVKTIYGYVRRGLIPYVKIQSNVRFPRQAILQWIEDQSYGPGTGRGSDGRKT